MFDVFGDCLSRMRPGVFGEPIPWRKTRGLCYRQPFDLAIEP